MNNLPLFEIVSWLFVNNYCFGRSIYARDTAASIVNFDLKINHWLAQSSGPFH